ncbi:VanZ family protein [Inconstantimicrobium mannanitabidum]|uniref:VanZ family protein n=1 Tax=Inconstantimicrobium mannanitabidum TaxID=1604901 RepID=UPI0021C32B75|nr:VanZ family protein [Clostridium sp. TW13]
MEPLAITLIILQAVVIFSIFKMFISRQIDKYSYYIIWTCYFFILAFVLFGRPTAFRKFNFNPLDILNGLNNFDSIFIYLLNILAFIPIGYIFRHKGARNMLLIMIPIEFLIETIQYIFKLGIFDINDIILNLIGICIGYIISKNKDLLKIENTSSANKNKDTVI